MQQSTSRHAVLYRMVTPSHVCPFGLKARNLLRRKGYDVDDRPLRSRAEQDAFKAEHDVDTTPQVFIDRERIGGYDALRRHMGLRVRDPDEVSYRPVLTVFAVAALLALGTSWLLGAPLLGLGSLERFIAAAMCLLAMLKLQDVESFSSMFLGYDLLAQRWVPYAYVYPYAELLAGVLMFSGLLPFVAIPVALAIGLVGAASVFKAVYIDRRELKCACVGGNAKVPLGFVSLTENVMMVAMAVWLLVSTLAPQIAPTVDGRRPAASHQDRDEADPRATWHGRGQAASNRREARHAGDRLA